MIRQLLQRLSCWLTGHRGAWIYGHGFRVCLKCGVSRHYD